MQWLATYKDGSTLSQYNEGVELSSEQINREQLETFALIDDDGETAFVLHLDPGQRLIFRRRNERAVGSEYPIVVYIVGWQQTIHGQNVQSICYVFNEGNRIEMAGRFRENHQWFYAPQLVPCEIEDKERQEREDTLLQYEEAQKAYFADPNRRIGGDTVSITKRIDDLRENTQKELETLRSKAHAAIDSWAGGASVDEALKKLD